MINLRIPVILASGSPRRKELLGGVIDQFEILVDEVDEEALTVSDPWQTAETLARAKAAAVFRTRPHALVIGADTVVAFEFESGWQQLAKPADPADAERMLLLLSGRSHVVITGVALLSSGLEDVFSETTTVNFRPLSQDEISSYVATGEPMDKAGAYAIQGGASAFATSIDGSLTNVIGLPVEALTKHLGSLAS